MYSKFFFTFSTQGENDQEKFCNLGQRCFVIFQQLTDWLVSGGIWKHSYALTMTSGVYTKNKVAKIPSYN